MTPTTGKGKSGQRGKSIEELTGFAISHRTRALSLIILRQGNYAASEVADIIGVPLNSVANHLAELADGGIIEVAETRRRGNVLQNIYRAVEIPVRSEEEMRSMRVFDRQMYIGAILQSFMAEMMASFWLGKFSEDPNHCLVWNRLHLDEQGRREVTKEQEAHWHRLQEIEEESVNRSAVSGDDTVPYIVGILGFERGRTAPVAPGSS
jgi:DNA-binding transcriptional ArsR family regulator